MRDYIVLAIIFCSLPFCFFRPYIGVLVFSWLAYMNPHRLAWGAAVHFPVANFVALAMLAGIPFAEDRQSLPMRRETILLFLLWGQFTLTSFFAFHPESAWHHWRLVSKILLITFVTMIFFIDHKRLKYLLLVISLSVGFYGIKGALFSLAMGGAYRVYGPPGTFLEDNNDLALALVMILPILFYLGQEQTRKLYRYGLWGAAGLCMLSIVFTYSRGGFLGLTAVLIMFTLRTKYRFVMIIVLILVVFAAFTFVPAKWFERMGTIKDYQEDGSAQGRINAWEFAINLALDRPFIGGGFNCFTRVLFFDYAPDPSDFHDAHSVYFELLGEHGFVGLGIFLALLGSLTWSLLRIRSRFRDVEEAAWIRGYADMIVLSLVGYLTSGAFLGRAYFDLSYQLIAVGIIVLTLAERLERTRLEEEQPEATPLGAVSTRGY